MTYSPTPDEIAEIIDRTISKINYHKSMDNSYLDCVPISDLETLIAAATRTDADSVVMKRVDIERVKRALMCDPDPPEYIGGKYKEALSILEAALGGKK